MAISEILLKSYIKVYSGGETVYMKYFFCPYASTNLYILMSE